MTFKLSPEIEARLRAAQEAHQEYAVVFAALSDADLAASAQFWMQHCEAPRRIEPGRPVYDSTFWHAIVPEMLRRLKR